ncbi:MAG TPA: MFS transporter [Clostridia bacterium]|nr:MFS transporter [Clostridia bacterium]
MEPGCLNRLKTSRKLLVWVVALLMFFLGFEAGGFQLVLLDVAKDFGLNTSTMGMLASMQFFATIGMPLFFGRLSDRIGKKRVLAFSLPVFILGCVLAGLAHSALLLVAGVAVLGAGFSVTECIATAALSDGNAGDSGRAISLVQSMFSLGAVAGPLFSDMLIRSLDASWRVVFMLAGGGFLLLYPLMLLADMPIVNNGASKSSSVFLLLKNKLLIALCAVMLLYVGFEVGLAFFVESLFVVEFSAPELGAFGISLFWLAMFVTRFLMSRIRTNRRHIVLGTLGLCALTVVALAFSKNAYFALVLYALLGAASGPVWPIVAGSALDACPGDTGAAASIMITAGNIGGAVGPALMGIVSQVFGLRIGLMMLSLISVGAAAILFIGLRDKKSFT